MALLLTGFSHISQGEALYSPPMAPWYEHIIYHVKPFEKMSHEKWHCTANIVKENKGEYVPSYFGYGFGKPFVEKVVLKRVKFVSADRLQKEEDSYLIICDSPSVQHKREELYAYKFPVEETQLENGIPVSLSLQAAKELENILSHQDKEAKMWGIQELAVYARGKEMCWVSGTVECPDALRGETGDYFMVFAGPCYTYRNFIIESFALEQPSFSNPPRHKEKKDWDFMESYFGKGFKIIIKEKVYLKIERKGEKKIPACLIYKWDENSARIKDQKGIPVFWSTPKKSIEDKEEIDTLKDGVYTLIGYESYGYAIYGYGRIFGYKKVQSFFRCINILEYPEKKK